MASNNSSTNSVPHPDADAATQWAFLEEGLHHMMNEPQNVPYPKYMSLYTVSYNYCTTLKIHGGGKPNEVRDGSFMGRDLYEKVTGFLEKYLDTLKAASESLRDDELLRYYMKEWDRYTAGAQYMNRLFTYLNRHWVKPQRDRGKEGVYPVYTLALVQWGTHFLPHIQSDRSKFTRATLRLVERHRKGQEADQTLVKKVVDTLLSLGIDETDLQKTTLVEYQEHFETAFLRATEKHYDAEAENFLAENTLVDYVKKVEEWLRVEGERADRDLDASTKKPLMSTCKGVLIQRHRKRIEEGVQSLADHEEEDVQRMRALLARTSDVLA